MSKTKRLMKDSGIEWIGEIPVGWEVIKTKFAASLYTGNSIKDEEKGLYEDPANAIPYIATKDIDVSNNSVDYVNGMFVKTSDSSFVRASSGDTLMCIEGGSAGRKKAKIDREVCFVNKLCCFHAEHIDSHYLFFVLNSPHYESEFQINLEGLIGGVSKSKLRNFLLPLPPLPEQQKIADYLDEKCGKIDLVIAKSEEIIEKLKAYKLSLITETVTKGLDPNAPMKDSGIEWIGEIPCHWHILRIKWLLNERNERSLSGKEEPLSMSQKYGLVPTRCMDTIPNMASTFVGAKLCYKNDLVFNKLKAHLGVFAVSHYDGLVSPDYAVYYSNTKVNLKYLEFLFKTPQYIGEFKKKSTGVGAGLTRLYTSDLYSIYCAFPPLPEQQKIADYLDAKCAAIDKNIADRQTLIEKLTAYKKSLIYEAVTGKKEI